MFGMFLPLETLSHPNFSCPGPHVFTTEFRVLESWDRVLEIPEQN